MTDRKGTILVGGFLGLIHAGGAVWDYIQYPLGLHLMGYDVYYLEDTRMYPVYGSDWNNSMPTIARLKSVMNDFGLDGRWIYRDEVTQTIYGKSEREYKEICGRADVFINVSCASVIRDEYSRIPVRILLDSDPMFTQIQINTDQSFTTEKGSLMDLAEWHTHHFTFGENINNDDCLIPETPFSWKVTRQPVCLGHWDFRELPPTPAAFTTLMNWKAGKTLQYKGESWGQKDVTFPVILGVPLQAKEEHFRIAVSQTGGGRDESALAELKSSGWQIVSPDEASGDHHLYQSFIYNSKGEISVAKETYVKARTGWFSGRSACYLAAGRPVITQDTGWSAMYPTGQGLFAFTARDQAVEAVRKVCSDWKSHAMAARGIANDWFDHRKVLGDMLRSL